MQIKTVNYFSLYIIDISTLRKQQTIITKTFWNVLIQKKTWLKRYSLDVCSRYHNILYMYIINMKMHKYNEKNATRKRQIFKENF